MLDVTGDMYFNKHDDESFHAEGRQLQSRNHSLKAWDLGGLTYDEVTDMPAGVWLDWLRQSPEYRTQPSELRHVPDLPGFVPYGRDGGYGCTETRNLPRSGDDVQVGDGIRDGVKS